jgi:SAM-dependent methyltransferase
VHGDICAPPFRPESFDFIFSIGVLHHTPDAERAFRGLVPLLKRGGAIAVYLYPRDASSRVSDVYRRFTVRLPKRLLYLLCHLAGPLYYLGEIPLVGPVVRFAMPISRHSNWRWRVLDTFDWYSPRYQSKHTYPEVFRWFRTSGLADVELMDVPVCVRGRKPAA